MHEEPEAYQTMEKLEKDKTCSRHDNSCRTHGNEWKPVIYQLDDGWTIVTEDGSLAAHYENTILITEKEPEILTI